MKYLLPLLAAVLTVATPSPLVAQDAMVTDRPDFTESSSVVGKCRLQIEGGYTYLHDESAGIALDEHGLPELLLRYGLTDCLELRVGWIGYVFSKEQDRAGGVTSEVDGGTGLDIGVKRQFNDQDGWMPESGVILGVTAPVGNPQIGTDRLGASVVGLYSWEVNDWLSIGGNTGGSFTAPGSDYSNVFVQSFSAGVSLTERFGMYHEWFMLAFDGAEDSRPQHFYDTGFTYLVTRNFQLDWRAGVGLSEAAADFFTGTGFAVRW